MKITMTIVLMSAMFFDAFGATIASAEMPGAVEVRVSENVKKFHGARQFALAFEAPSPEILRARHMELAVGSVFDDKKRRAFISLGPVWQLPIRGKSLFARFGFSPTLIGGSSFGERDLGGNLHFTSSVSIGGKFGRSDSISVLLRAQHTSNGGLHGTNPGLDMVGLSFAYNLDPQ